MSMCLADANKVEIFELTSRDANEIKASIQEFLSQEAVVTVDQNKIIIKSDAKNLADLRQIIAAMDVAKKQLKLEVYWGESPDDVANSIVISTNQEQTGKVQVLYVEDGETVALTKTSLIKLTKTMVGEQQQAQAKEHKKKVVESATETDKQSNYDASYGAVKQDFINLPEGIYLKPKLLNATQLKVDINIIRANNGVKKAAAEVRPLSQQIHTVMQVGINKWQRISGQDEIPNTTEHVTTYSTGKVSGEQKIWLKISVSF